MFSLSACGSKPQLVSQGKLISAESIAQLQLGMTKQQTQITLGSPVIIDRFSPNTWIYYFSQGKITDKNPSRTGKLVLKFQNDQLAQIAENDSIVSNKSIQRGGTIITEPTQKKRGIFNRF